MPNKKRQSGVEKSKSVKEERAAALNLILDDKSNKKLVVAGPGTGKTYLFKELSKRSGGDHVAITFINSLAIDLKKELAGLSDAGTFHRLCKHLLHKLKPSGITSDFSYFPKLPKIIQSDYKVLKNSAEQVDFDDEFQILNEAGTKIDFFLERADYYDAVGHNDSVYRVIQKLRSESKLTPKYDLVMVDEYQDFNALEVEMIHLLEIYNPIVIVGDDDQALYKLKNASPKFIRKLHTGREFTKFYLPYCSRCTEVIVNASNNLISTARKYKMLEGRIEKEFKCFSPGKEVESNENPSIVLAECSVHNKSAPYISKYILKEIRALIGDGYEPIDDDSIFDFLVVAKGEDLLSSLFEHLSKEFENVQSREKHEQDLTKLDCFQEILASENSRIGWRGLLEFEPKRIRDKVIKDSAETKKGIIELVPDKFLEGHSKTLEILKLIKSGEDIDITEEKWLEDYFEMQLSEIKNKLFPDVDAELPGEDPAKQYKIKVTTFMGCKGLSSNYVFLAGINNGILPHNSNYPTDDEVCQLLVGLTRTRKRCHLVYARHIRGAFSERSCFISWIDKQYFEAVKVDKHFFK